MLPPSRYHSSFPAQWSCKDIALTVLERFSLTPNEAVVHQRKLTADGWKRFCLHSLVTIWAVQGEIWAVHARSPVIICLKFIRGMCHRIVSKKDKKSITQNRKSVELVLRNTFEAKRCDEKFKRVHWHGERISDLMVTK